VIIDVSHAITPHDVQSAAFVLSNAYKSFPPGTVHVVVVDPGVGSDRRAILVESHDHVFVAPDNGVLSFVMDQDARVYEIPIPDDASATFHGRDVFAQTAARCTLDQAKTYKMIASADCIQFSFPKISVGTARIKGAIVYIDIFGNMITNIPTSYELKAVSMDQVAIPIVPNYAEGRKDMAIAVRGSSGFYEIAVNKGNAQERYQGRIGKEVIGER